MSDPATFRDGRLPVMNELVLRRSLALSMTCGHSGFAASPVPVPVYPGEGDPGVPRAHLARATPHWRDLGAVDECLEVFQGADGYKWKMSQNRLPVDREGVVRGLRSVDDAHRIDPLASIVEGLEPRSTTAQGRRRADVGNARSKGVLHRN